MKRWKRGLSAVAAATLSLAVSTPTWASVTHYYGVAVWFNAPQNAGTEANLYISNGSAADWSASYAGFIAQVLWEGTSNNGNGDYWVEAGYTYGWQQQNIATWYWADNRPTYGYDEHQITSVPVTVGATMPVTSCIRATTPGLSRLMTARKTGTPQTIHHTANICPLD